MSNNNYNKNNNRQGQQVTSKNNINNNKNNSQTYFGRRQGYKKNNNNNKKIQVSKFKGRCEELIGHVYDCETSTQCDQFVITTREICEYVGRTYKYGGDIKITLERLKVYDIPQPEAPTDLSNDEVKKLIFSREIDEYVKRKSFLRENLKTVYSLIWGQCSEYMRAKVQANDDYENFSGNQDPVALLKAIKSVNFKFEEHRYIYHSVFDAYRNFYIFRQAQDKSNSEYLEQFKNVLEVLQQHGGSIGNDELFINHDKIWKTLATRNRTDDNKERALARCKERFLAYSFIYKADNERYGKLKEELQNDYMKGNNTYPETLVEAFQLLNNYKQPYKKQPAKSTGVSFTQKGKGGRNNSNRNAKQNYNNNTDNSNRFADYECYNCHKKGHIAPNCPDKNKTEASNVQVEEHNTESSSGIQNASTQLLNETEVNPKHKGCHSLIQYDICNYIGKNALKHWILLDNQSTADIFCNSNILQNIEDTDERMTIFTNGGSLSTCKKGYLNGYGEVWYHPDAITNILSLNNVKKKFRVTYDSNENDRFILHKPEKLVYFNCSSNGLYYHDTRSPDFTLVNTVEENKVGFSQRQLEQAKKARKLYHTMGLPSMHDYIELVRNNMLYNCPITVEDIENSFKIYGQSPAALKGKVTRKKPDVVSSDYFEVPEDILEKHKFVTLCADIFYVQKIPFFVTVSRHLKLTTVQLLVNRKSESILEGIDSVIAVYKSRGFQIITLLMDREIMPMLEELKNRNIRGNPTSANEHVPEIERQIRVIKERVRGIYNTLPYATIPKLMMTELVYYVVAWLNNFPPKGGVSQSISPRAMFTGVNLDFNKHCKLQFGEYVQVHEENTPTNSMQPRSTGAIALGSTYNIQSGYKFLSLNTGKLIYRRAFTVIPLTSL